MAETQVAPNVSIQIEIPSDSQAKRDWVSRWIIAALLVGLTIAVPFWVASQVGDVLELPVFGKFVGVGLSMWLLTLLVPRLIIDNPEWAAYVTLNPIGGHMVPYGPGIHIAYPWEERNEDGNFSLQVITRPFSLTSPTKTAAVTVSGRLFYNASLPFITRAIGVDQEIVEEGNVAFIQSNMIATLAGKDAEDAIKSTQAISDDLNSKFRDQQTPAGIVVQEEFEQKFGYSTAAIVIDKIAFSPKVQEARDAVSEARKMHEIAAGLFGVTPDKMTEMVTNKIISPKQLKELVDRALVASGNATMNLNVIEGEMKDAVANYLTQSNQGGRS
jgi:hypothetical protein